MGDKADEPHRGDRPRRNGATNGAANGHAEGGCWHWPGGAGVKRINVALQGGGAHGAFAWGVLDRLLEDPRIEIEAVSGTSAGAMNAVVAAHGLKIGGPAKARERLEAFWRRVSVEAIASPIKRSLPDMLFSNWNLDHNPVLALVDQRLPGKFQGDMVGERIRQSKKLSHIAIVLMTAYRLTKEQEDEVMKKAGADALVYKSLPRLRDFRTMLENIIEKRGLSVPKE